MNDLDATVVAAHMPRAGTGAALSGPVLVRTGHKVWFIERGTVDVFTVTGSGSAPDGPRSYLFSAGAGELLAFPDLALGETEGLALVPGPDASCHTVTRSDLLAVLAHAEQAQSGMALLDGLAANMASALAVPVPSGSNPLRAGTRHVAGANPDILAPATGGLWVELETGRATLGDGVALAPGTPVPVPASTWIELAPGAVLDVYGSTELAARRGCDVLLAGVEHFFLGVYASALARRRLAEIEELDRLQRKADIGQRVMADALDALAALFRGRAGDPGAAAGDERVLAACRILGQVQGIVFKAPPPSPPGVRRDLSRAIAQASGVRSRLVALKGTWWLQDNGPLLAHVAATKEAYALLPQRGGGYHAIDPQNGAEQRVDQAFADSLAPFAAVFYASLPVKQLVLGDIVRLAARGKGKDIATVAAIGLASALLGMGIPLASGLLFDSIFPAADEGQMVQVVVVLFIAGLVTLLFEATRSLAMLRIEGKASSDLQAAVWDRVLGLPAPFFRAYAAGDLADRINGINEIRQALSGTVVTTLISSLFSVLNLFLLFYYSSRLALVALGLVTVAILFNIGLGWISVRSMRASADLNGKVAGLVLEYLSGITKLRMTGSESRAFANWAAGFAAQKRAALRAGRFANISAVFGTAFPVASSAVIFATIGVAMAHAPDMQFSTGEFIAFSAAWTIFLGAALALVKTGIDLLGVASTWQRTRPILDAIPEVNPGKPDPGVLEGAIELSNIGFSYGRDTPPVLDDVSLSIRAGEFVALVGSSGSGKSTLLRLMLGFEKPSSGGVYYDGHNLDEVDVGAVRRQLGVVLQSGRLMSGDIYSNIVGATGLTLDAAWEAATACGLDRDINDMPMGMHSLVSDGGGTLSGGQRQRLLIARAIVAKPRIILFDEATSALDNRSQATVSASIDKLRATRVVIAHRLSTIMNADRIVVLDKGRIVQCGSYDQLIRQEGLFADLAKRQMA